MRARNADPCPGTKLEALPTDWPPYISGSRVVECQVCHRTFSGTKDGRPMMHNVPLAQARRLRSQNVTPDAKMDSGPSEPYS